MGSERVPSRRSERRVSAGRGSWRGRGWNERKYQVVSKLDRSLGGVTSAGERGIVIRCVQIHPLFSLSQHSCGRTGLSLLNFGLPANEPKGSISHYYFRLPRGLCWTPSRRDVRASARACNRCASPGSTKHRRRWLILKAEGSRPPPVSISHLSTTVLSTKSDTAVEQWATVKMVKRAYRLQVRYRACPSLRQPSTTLPPPVCPLFAGISPGCPRLGVVESRVGGDIFHSWRWAPPGFWFFCKYLKLSLADTSPPPPRRSKRSRPTPPESD